MNEKSCMSTLIIKCLLKDWLYIIHLASRLSDTCQGQLPLRYIICLKLWVLIFNKNKGSRFQKNYACLCTHVSNYTLTNLVFNHKHNTSITYCVQSCFSSDPWHRITSRPTLSYTCLTTHTAWPMLFVDMPRLKLIGTVCLP